MFDGPLLHSFSRRLTIADCRPLRLPYPLRPPNPLTNHENTYESESPFLELYDRSVTAGEEVRSGACHSDRLRKPQRRAQTRVFVVPCQDHVDPVMVVGHLFGSESNKKNFWKLHQFDTEQAMTESRITGVASLQP